LQQRSSKKTCGWRRRPPDPSALLATLSPLSVAAFSLYTLLATAIVWVPVVAYLLAGGWAVARLDAGLGWLGRYRRPLLKYALPRSV
jgi:hypothetical protein